MSPDAITDDHDSGVKSRPFEDIGLSRCLDAGYRGLGDDRAGALGAAMIGLRDERGEALAPFARCLTSQRPGRAALRERYERAIRADRDYGAQRESCTIARLKNQVPSRVVADQTVAAALTGEPVGARLERLTDDATLVCDRREIAGAARRVVRGPAAEACGDVVTRRFVGRMFVGGESCRALVSGAEATSLRLDRARVDDDRARLRVSYRVRGIGVDGEMTVLRRGGRWQVDDLGRDLLRSQAGAATEMLYFVGSPSFSREEVFTQGSVRPCVDGRVASLPLPKLRRVGVPIGAREQSDQPDRTLRRVAEGCMADSRAGRATAMNPFVLAVSSGARESGAPAAERRCIAARLRKTANAQRIADKGLSYDEGTDPDPDGEINRLIDGAVRSCFS